MKVIILKGGEDLAKTQGELSGSHGRRRPSGHAMQNHSLWPEATLSKPYTAVCYFWICYKVQITLDSKKPFLNVALCQFPN